MAYFGDLCRDGLGYDSYTLAIALKACVDACLLRSGNEIHAQTLKKGFDTTSFVANTVVLIRRRFWLILLLLCISNVGKETMLCTCLRK